LILFKNKIKSFLNPLPFPNNIQFSGID